MMRPNANESYEAYAIRAHRNLRSQVKDPEQRNEIVEASWRAARGATDEAEEVAASKLGPDKFTRKSNVCYFSEHDTTDAKGQPRSYGLRELARICRSANNRIADVAAFPAISDGHTSDPEEGREQPDTLGYVGGYRLGMIGRKNPRWAIFADEYHQKGDAEARLAKKPRRSVELWTFNDDRGSFFDPVAALGSEAPRLPLPVQFQQRKAPGQLVSKYHLTHGADIGERYLYAEGMPAYAGGSNTYTKRFGADEMGALANPHATSEFMAALMETPQWQWLTQQMEADQRGAEDMADDGEPSLADEYTGDAMGDAAMPGMDASEYDTAREEYDAMPEDSPGPPAEAPAGADDDLADLAALLAEEEGDMPAVPDGEEEDEEQYMRRHAQTSSEISELQRYNQALQAENAQQSKRLIALEQRGADGERRSLIGRLAAKFAINEDDELKACLYSQGSRMTDAEFRNHVKTIEKYATPAAERMRMAPAGEFEQHPQRHSQHGSDTSTPERYQKSVADRAVAICTANQRAGKPIDYDAAKNQAIEELGPAPG